MSTIAPAGTPYTAGTAAAAAAVFVLLLAGAPQAPTAILDRDAFTRVILPEPPASSSRATLPLAPLDLRRTAQATDQSIELLETNRATTDAEHAAGELRSWRQYGPNWDGEGSAAPSGASLSAAIAFIHSTTDSPIPGPEPVLHPSGRAGLFWDEPGLYADLEFYEDGRITYFVERSPTEKARGVTKFDGKVVPGVLAALLVPKGEATST